MSTAHRGQHKTQRGAGVFVEVDIENVLRSSKTFHQSRELTPVAQTVPPRFFVPPALSGSSVSSRASPDRAAMRPA
jgi:hypothetical protein